MVGSFAWAFVFFFSVQHGLIPLEAVFYIKGGSDSGLIGPEVKTH